MIFQKILLGLTLLLQVRALTIKVLAIPAISNITAEKISLESLTNVFKVATNNDIDIKFELVSSQSSNSYADLVTDLFKIKDNTHDIIMLDVVWPGAFADNLLDLTEYDTLENLIEGHIPAVARNNLLGEKLVALPISAEYGFLYYRADLLKKYGYNDPPKTWDELEEMALKILEKERAAGNRELTGYVSQFNSYEGLTCNVMEWIWSNDGGHVIESDRTVTLNNEANINMFNRIKRFFTSGITPLSARLFNEGSSLDVWLEGNAIFMRNWPYAIGETTNKAKFNTTMNVGFGVSPLPGITSGRSAATIGGWHFGVNKYTQYPKEAVQAIKYLTSLEYQKQRLLQAYVPPTRSILFEDPEVCAAFGKCELFAKLDPIARPSTMSGSNYLAVSQVIYQGMSLIIRGAVDTATQLKEMTMNIQKAIGTWVEPVIDLGPPRYLSLTNPITLVVLIVSILCLVACIIIGGLIAKNSRKKSIISASPRFCLLMISGCVLALLGLILSSGKPSEMTCMIAPWLGATAMSVTMGGLLVKTIRIYIIFTNPFKAKTLPLQDSHLFIAVGILTVLEMIILAIWTAVDPLRPTLSPQVTFQNLVCDSGPTGATLGNILFAFNGVLIFMGVVMAIKTRNVVSKYNESTQIGICMYTMFISFLILLALPQLKSSNVVVPYIISAVTILFTIITVIAILIVSKLIAADEEEGNKKVDGSGAAGGASSLVSKNKDGTSTANQPMTRSSESIMMNCQYRFASSASMLAFANWKQSELYFDTGVSLLSFSNMSNPTQFKGKSCFLAKKDVKDIKVETLGEDVHQVSCSIGYNVWQIQMRSSHSAKALEDALKTLK